MKKFIIIIFIVGLFAQFTHSSYEDIGSSRTIAMGGSLVSVVGYSDVAQINPALLWYLNGDSIYLSYSREYTKLQNDKFDYMFISYGRLQEPIFGFAVYDSFFNTNYYQENTLGFALGRGFSKYFSLGLTTNIYAKIYKSNQYTENDPYYQQHGKYSIGYGFDVGTLFKPTNRLNIGFVMKNLNKPDMSVGDIEDKLPMEMIIGTSYNFGFIQPSFDIEYIFEDIGGEKQLLYHLGVEARLFKDIIAIRGGYRKNTASFGMGLGLTNMNGLNLALDYTFLAPTGEMKPGGYTHHVGLTFGLGAREKEKEIIKKYKSFSFEYPEMLITRIDVNLSEEYESEEVSIEQIPVEDSHIKGFTEESEKAYFPVDITSSIPNEVLTSADLRIAVSKQWIDKHNIDADTITLNRVDEETGVSEKIHLRKEKEDSLYIYYSAITDHFSKYFITGEPIEPEDTDEIPDTDEITDESTGETEKEYGITRTHTVIIGDCLFTIAGHYYHDPFLWRIIYEANSEKIDDPHWIYPGQILTIPPKP